MSKKVVLDLEAAQPPRRSTVNPIHLPQSKQQPYSIFSTDQKTPSSPIPTHPMHQLFNRPHMLDLDAYTSFRQNMIQEPTCSQILKGWIILAITIPFMSLGLMTYKFTEGNVVMVAFQISVIFAVVNFVHWIFFFKKDNLEEEQESSIKTIIEATILKIIRAVLTSFLTMVVPLSYVSLLLGYSSHMTLFIIMLNSNFDSYKLLFVILIFTMIPIGINFNILYTFLGLLMTSSYLRLQTLKQNPLHSGISWFFCGAVMFVVMMLTRMNFQLVYYGDFIVAIMFVVLSSKVGKEFLLRHVRGMYVKEEGIKCAVKMIPFILWIVNERETYEYLGVLVLGVVGTLLSEYKSEVEDSEDMIVFT